MHVARHLLAVLALLVPTSLHAAHQDSGPPGNVGYVLSGTLTAGRAEAGVAEAFDAAAHRLDQTVAEPGNRTLEALAEVFAMDADSRRSMLAFDVTLTPEARRCDVRSEWLNRIHWDSSAINAHITQHPSHFAVSLEDGAGPATMPYECPTLEAWHVVGFAQFPEEVQQGIRRIANGEADVLDLTLTSDASETEWRLGRSGSDAVLLKHASLQGGHRYVEYHGDFVSTDIGTVPQTIVRLYADEGGRRNFWIVRLGSIGSSDGLTEEELEPRIDPADHSNRATSVSFVDNSVQPGLRANISLTGPLALADLSTLAAQEATPRTRRPLASTPSAASQTTGRPIVTFLVLLACATAIATVVLLAHRIRRSGSA